jgi:hypothetical protein
MYGNIWKSHSYALISNAGQIAPNQLDRINQLGIMNDFSKFQVFPVGHCREITYFIKMTVTPLIQIWSGLHKIRHLECVVCIELYPLSKFHDGTWSPSDGFTLSYAVKILAGNLTAELYIYYVFVGIQGPMCKV